MTVFQKVPVPSSTDQMIVFPFEYSLKKFQFHHYSPDVTDERLSKSELESFFEDIHSILKSSGLLFMITLLNIFSLLYIIFLIVIVILLIYFLLGNNHDGSFLFIFMGMKIVTSTIVYFTIRYIKPLQ